MLRSKSTSRTEPTTEPVTAADVKTQTRIDYTEHDQELEALITTARKIAEEGYLWRALLTQTCIDKFDEFAEEMELRWSPPGTLTSVKYIDTSGVTQTLVNTVYELGSKNEMGILRLKYGQSWPSIRSHEDAVTVTYTAGYGAAVTDVPAPIRRGIMLLTEWLYNGCEDDKVLQAARHLLEPLSAKRVV